MQITKKERRQRRAIKTRMKIRELGVARLTVHRTPQHIYAQVFDAAGSKVLASASTVQEKVSKGLKCNRQRRGRQGRRHRDRRGCQGRGRHQGRVRSRGLHVSRPRQGAGRRRA